VTHRPLDGIELVVFDKDGTLIDFHAMWGGWVRSLATDLERATGLDLRGALFEVLGADPTSGLVRPRGVLAATPMARIREIVVDTLVEQGLDRPRAEDAVSQAWHPPDPVELAHPLADLPRLFATLETLGIRTAIATTDDRGPTERTLAALGIAGDVAMLACADDGIRPKPAPDPVLRICERLGIGPERTAVVGDSPADLEMGHAAGVRLLVGVLTGVGDRAALSGRADLLLGSIEDLVPA
jgi:phosphoglycolate phosphatase-like HAD superfamily hydrolase